MTSTFLVGRAASALIVLAAVGFAGAILRAPESPLRRWIREYRERRQRELSFLRSSFTADGLLALQLTGVVLSVGIAVTAGVLPGAAVLVMTLLTPGRLLSRARARRVVAMEEQLEGFLTMVENALEASPSLGEALSSSARLMESPLRDEVEQLLAEHGLGSPLDRALEAASDRIGSRLVSTALLTLRIGRNTGGSLQQILHGTAANLREMARLEGVVRTKTAEGKAQAAVVSAIPVPLYLGIRFMSPGFFDPLETTTLGHVLMAVASVLWVAAALLARRILAVDV